jgi:AcrR family transcriptional regulator
VRLSRRRGEALRQAIFDAVFAQLRAVGYPRLTMGAVAAAAGTGKAALYRRWCTKEDLVAEALLHGLPSPDDLPRHDNVRDDLVELLRYLLDALLRTHGAGLQADDAAVRRAFRERAVEPCQRLILDALRRGAERGEVKPEAATTKVAAVGPAMIVHQVLTEGAEVPDGYVESLVDEVLLRMA